MAGLLMWESADGLEWTQVQGLTGVPAGFENGRVFVVSEGFVARGETFGDDGHEGRTAFLYSADGREWTDVTPGIELLDGEHVYFYEDIVVGDAGTLAIGSIEFHPPQPPLEVAHGDHTLVIDYERDRLEIVDREGGVRYVGSPDELHGGGRETDDGIAVFDPQSGEQLFVLSWDVIGEIDEMFTDIDHGADPHDVIVDVDTYTLAILGYEPGTPEGADFEIHDAATGSLVARGSFPELTEGPPPRFVAADGTVLVEFPSWDAWWEAEHLAYEQFEEGFEEQFYSKPIALVTTGGESWQVVDLSGGIASNQNAYLHQAFAGPEGFLIRGSVDNRDTHRSTEVEWTSVDGISWDLAPAPESEHFLWGVSRTSAGLLGIAGEEAGAAVLFSENGQEWEPALVVTGEDGTYSFVQSFDVGDLGAVVVVVTEGPWEGGDFHVDEYHEVTTTIAAGHAPATAAPATTVVSHSEEGHEAEEFGDVEFFESRPPQTVLYVSFDGRTFLEVADDGSFSDMWITKVHVVGDRVFVFAQENLEEHGDTEFEEFTARPLVVLVGTRIG